MQRRVYPHAMIRAAAIVAAVLVAVALPRDVAAIVGLVRQTSLQMPLGDGFAVAPASDGTWLFIPTSNDLLVKFHLGSMSRFAALSLPASSNPQAVVLRNGFAFVACATAPSTVIKINPNSTMSVVTALSLTGFAVAESSAIAMVADAVHLFVSSIGVAPSVLSRVVMADMSRPGVRAQLQLASGENSVQSMVLNPAATTLIVCSFTSPDTRCARVQLSTFSRSDGLTLTATPNVQSIVHDGTFVFAASAASPARVVKIDTSGVTMTQAAVSVLSAPSNNARAVTLCSSDPLHVYAFLHTTPMSCVKLRRSDLSLAAPIIPAGAADDQTARRGAVFVGRNAYVVAGVSPFSVVKWVSPTHTRTRTLIVPVFDALAAAAPRSTVSRSGVAGIAASFGIFFVVVVAGIVYCARRHHVATDQAGQVAAAPAVEPVAEYVAEPACEASFATSVGVPMGEPASPSPTHAGGWTDQ